MDDDSVEIDEASLHSEMGVEGEETATELASRWKRLGGALIDSSIALGIFVPIMIAAGIFEQLKSGIDLSLKQTVIFLVAGQILFLLLNGVLLARYGQTIGKKVVGTRIVLKSTGQIASWKKVYFMRYLLKGLIGHIPIVGSVFKVTNMLFIFRKDKRCVHDFMAGTIVVNAK